MTEEEHEICGACKEPVDQYICDECSTAYCGCGKNCDCDE